MHKKISPSIRTKAENITKVTTKEESSKQTIPRLFSHRSLQQGAGTPPPVGPPPSTARTKMFRCRNSKQVLRVEKSQLLNKSREKKLTLKLTQFLGGILLRKLTIYIQKKRAYVRHSRIVLRIFSPNSLVRIFFESYVFGKTVHKCRVLWYRCLKKMCEPVPSSIHLGPEYVAVAEAASVRLEQNPSEIPDCVSHSGCFISNTQFFRLIPSSNFLWYFFCGGGCLRIGMQR